MKKRNKNPLNYMQTVITLNNKKPKLPKQFQINDNRYTESLAKYFLERYSKKGDKVIDIFAGFGTTLFVCEKINRIPFGIEIDKKRYNFIKNKIKDKNNIILGDSLKLNKYQFPKFDFSITSPPYTYIGNKNLLGNKNGYNGYLKDIGSIYRKLKHLMKKNSWLVIEVSNIKKKEVTTLAWDIAKEVSKVFHFEGEVIVAWKNNTKQKNSGNYGHGYDHSYCLVFKNK